MGLFGALFAGVSGLDAQANKIGIISNNISNVNTVGFKGAQAAFDTLVVPSGTTTFSPGGVISNTQGLVTQQGLIQATSSPTDVAITGNGFFSVNSKSDGTGESLLTRVGSFTQNSSGDFVNANGYFLQGIPVTTPPTSVNLNNLKTVTVNQNATGTASATKTITLGANLNAAQSVLLGSAVNGTMNTVNGTSTINSGVTGNEILTGNDLLATPNSNLVRGDQITITSGSNAPLTFTYGGFTIGRDVTRSVAAGEGDGGNLLLVTPENLANNAFTADGADNSVKVAVTNGLDYKVGQTIYISGATAVHNILAANINGERVITNVAGNTVTFTAGGNDNGGAGVYTGGGAAATASNRTEAFTGNMLNATTTTADFLNSGANPLQASNFTSTALKFTIAVGGTTPISFTYSSAPSAASSTFNSLQSLADAINDASGLTARIANNRLYVSATDATQSLSFANGDAVGTPASNPPLSGINWLQELDLPVSMAAPATPHTFNTLNGLAAQINIADSADLLATVHNPTATASITINEANPQQTIVINDIQNPTSILKELGIQNLTTITSGPLTGDGTTGTLPVIYNPTSATTDMSSGAVTPQFSHDVTIFDAQGNSHTIAMNVVKIATNEWAVEFTAVPKTDVTSTTGDGQIASGILKFDGNGVLTSDTVPGSITVGWTNGANPSTLTFDLGLGGTGNVTQSAAAFNVSLANQDGSPIGQLTGVAIDASGFVTETFSNGQTKQVFQVPLASVPNPDGLQGVSGDAYQETLGSGQVNLNDAGQGGTGTITPSSLEQSNVDLSKQLTDLIVAQQAYGAQSKLLTVADQLLQEINQVIQ